MATLQDTTIRDCLITGEVEFYDCDIKINSDENEFIILKVVNRELRIQDETTQTLADLHAKDIEADGFFIGDGSQLTNLPSNTSTFESGETLQQNIAVRLIDDNGTLKAVKATSLISPNSIDFVIDSTSTSYSRIQFHWAEQNKALISFVNSNNSIDLAVVTFDPNAETIQLGPITNTFMTPADTDATPNAVAFEFVSSNAFIIAGQDNIRMGSYDTNSNTVNMTNWWGFSRDALSLDNISSTRVVAVSRNSSQETVAEIFEHDGTDITASFGTQSFRNGNPGREWSDHSNVAFDDDSILSTFANEKNNEYGEFVAGFRNGNSYGNFTNETVFVSQNMSNTPYRFDTTVISNSPNIALVLYTKTVSGRKVAAYRLIEVDSTQETTSVSNEVTIIDDPSGDIEKIQIDNFENSTYGISYVINIGGGEYEGNYAFLNMDGITSISGNITGTLSTSFNFYQNTQNVEALSNSSEGSSQVFISAERNSGSPFLIASKENIVESRSSAIGITGENTLTGEVGEVYTISQIAEGVVDENSDDLIPSSIYYINPDGTIGLTDTGFPIGVAIDFNKLVVISTNR